MTKLTASPASGSHHLFYRGDIIKFRLEVDSPIPGRAYVRTNLGSAARRRYAIIAHIETREASSIQDWHDIEMLKTGDTTFEINVALTEVGHFEAKCCLFPDDTVEPVWPDGDNVHINVEPAEYCCANSIYCAFVRQFGPNKNNAFSKPVLQLPGETLNDLDSSGFTVIPPSGKFRDLIKELDHIVDDLNCRILHLLPINPTPTVYARMGRYGSPYAALDFFDVDPALAEFDRKATPIDQFLELVDAVHRKNAKIFLDIAINHTGWAAKIHEEHPEWLMRDADGSIHSPGAWGVTWGDLTELNKDNRNLWDYFAKMFSTWCGRGVDGFRCDAGYMIPVPAWEYIISKVRNEYPATIFLLEGLGGDPAVTRQLLDRANMNWAYSELFQNYSRQDIEKYISFADSISEGDGLMVHYAETHDNSRLAAESTDYAKMRTALCALLSWNGAFGFANGVEWFATEKIDVHEARALNWGSTKNQVKFIARINTILITHPAFHQKASIRFVDSGNPNILAAARTDASGKNPLLVLINLDCKASSTCLWKADEVKDADGAFFDLITGEISNPERPKKNQFSLKMPPGQVLCLTASVDDCRKINEAEDDNIIRPDRIDRQIARGKVLDIMYAVKRSLAVVDVDIAECAEKLLIDPFAAIASWYGEGAEVPLVHWRWPEDLRRQVMIPPDHNIIITAPHRFRATISFGNRIISICDSLKTTSGKFFALFTPMRTPRFHQNLNLDMVVYTQEKSRRDQSELLLLTANATTCRTTYGFLSLDQGKHKFLEANGRGGILHPCLEWSELRSRYDALLLANLNPDFPEDRHVMFRRCRLWARYHGRHEEFRLETTKQVLLNPDDGATWRFHIPLGNGIYADISMHITIEPGKNAVRLKFIRHSQEGDQDLLDDDHLMQLIVRPDIEDRNFHYDTKASQGPENNWPQAVTPAPKSFSFKPAPERELEIFTSKGCFKSAPEWQYNIFQQDEADRGLEANTDLFSPGYFEISLSGGEDCEIIGQVLTPSEREKIEFTELSADPFEKSEDSDFSEMLLRAMDQFIVKRNDLKTVIAGYPWFLDWGRDTLICLRGMISAGKLKDAEHIILQFAKFEKDGTLPNMINGNNASNRDTTDAPLWFFVACRDYCQVKGSRELLEINVRDNQTLLDILKSIANGYINGTPNGIKMDEASGLIFSPPHFTWMDTNFPAGTPREGYPIEIQGIWYAALDFLAEILDDPKWRKLADKVQDSIKKHYWMDKLGWLSDCLHASPGVPAAEASPDDHLRPNQLFAVTLGAVSDPEMQRSIITATAELLVPGAIRTLADREVAYPLPVMKDGNQLNDPESPYWGHYEGDEDTRRKPAYHNGTAWTWPFPSWCEAYFQVYGEPARKTAKAVLSSAQIVMDNGCIGQIPEIIDGDFPHKQRGCDAQAWGVTEICRVWTKLSSGL